jgi:hypothetical protein
MVDWRVDNCHVDDSHIIHEWKEDMWHDNHQLHHNDMVAVACAIHSSSYTRPTNVSYPLIRLARFRFF